MVSTVGCDCGVIHVYDSLYRSVSRETLSLIASMVYSPSSELNITKMDVEKQSNGSDCGVLAIAYAFDICKGLNPCNVRFDSKQDQAAPGYLFGEVPDFTFPCVGWAK